MRNRSRVCLIALSLLLSHLHCASAEVPGVIEGTVVDVDGKPVTKIRVAASVVSSIPEVGVLRYATTNDQGQFSIRDLAFKAYALSTRGEDMGYPDTSFTFYAGGPSLIATLTEANPVQSVRIQLGPKARKVLLNVLDDSSGSIIENAGVRVAHSDEPARWMVSMIKVGQPILVPVDVDIEVVVQVKGYKEARLTVSKASANDLQDLSQASVVQVRVIRR